MTSSVWETALEIASRITHPYAIASFALVFAVMTLGASLKRKRSSISWLLALILLTLGLSPLIAATYLESRGVYRIRIVVLGPDGRPNDDATLTSSTGGELKRAIGNYEFDLPPQAKPSDGQIVFFASLKEAYLAGTSTLVLARDYYPTLIVKLSPLPSIATHGNVVDEHGRSVSGALVSVAGYSDTAVTDEMGNFSVASHHAEGQLLTLRVQKGRLSTEVSAIAGKDTELVLRKLNQ